VMSGRWHITLRGILPKGRSEAKMVAMVYKPSSLVGERPNFVPSSFYCRASFGALKTSLYFGLVLISLLSAPKSKTTRKWSEVKTGSRLYAKI
jgi:hypothetical protein